MSGTQDPRQTHRFKVELLERLVALVSPPRIRRHRYFEVVARAAASGKYPR